MMLTKVYLLLVFLVCASLLFPQTIDNPSGGNYALTDSISADTPLLKPDYRNRINIPEYDPSLTPLNYFNNNRYPNNQNSTATWTEVNPLIPRVDYLGIHFRDTLNGWAVGAQGAVIYSTDGGNKWRTANSPVTSVLLNVHSYNGQVVVASGYNGVILLSTDRGINWMQVASGVGGDLWEIKMLNDTLGWACGSGASLLRTTNAGVTWHSINTGHVSFNYWTFDFLSEELGFVGGNGGNILKTIDGGITWTLMQTGSGQSIYRLRATDSLHIVAGGSQGLVSYTFNGGNSWNYSYTGAVVDGMVFLNDSVGYVAGSSDFYLYKTNDGGVTWGTLYLGLNPYWIMFVNDSIGYTSGLKLGVRKSVNGGNHWRQLIINDDFKSVWSLSENTSLAVGKYFTIDGLYKTIDDGMTWKSVFPDQDGDLGLSCIFFIDSVTGFVGTNFNVRIYKTTDAGESWSRKNVTGVTGLTFPVRNIFFINHFVGWAVAGGGALLKTTDGGENWLTLNNSMYGKAIQFWDTLNGYILSSKLNRTTDGGLTWSSSILPGINASDDFYFHNEFKGWLTSFNTLYQTTNSGNSWYLIPNIGGFNFGYFNWLTKTRCFLVGTKTYYSIDSGSTWMDITESLGGLKINRMHSSNASSGYAVGDLGLIIKYFDSAYIPVELLSFKATIINENNVNLQWTTASEINNNGFIVERKDEKGDYEQIGFVTGSGTTIKPQNYFFEDKNLGRGIYKYKLNQMDYNGKNNLLDELEIKIDIISDIFELYSNYPNPFNQKTIITFSTSISENIKLKIFNLLGEEIATIFNDVVEAEKKYSIEFDGEKLSSGIYYCVLTQNKKRKSAKMIHLK